MEIFLVRHPETQNNKDNILTGWGKTGYTKHGKKQFDTIIDFFKKSKKTIYASDLPRALKLANAMSKQNKSKLIISRLLRERNFKQTMPLNSSESKQDFKKRITRFITKYNIKNCIIVSHAGAIKEFLRDLPISVKVSSPIERIFKIERNKKQKKL